MISVDTLRNSKVETAKNLRSKLAVSLSRTVYSEFLVH